MKEGPSRRTAKVACILRLVPIRYAQPVRYGSTSLGLPANHIYPGRLTSTAVLTRYFTLVLESHRMFLQGYKEPQNQMFEHIIIARTIVALCDAEKHVGVTLLFGPPANPLRQLSSSLFTVQVPLSVGWEIAARGRSPLLTTSCALTLTQVTERFVRDLGRLIVTPRYLSAHTYPSLN